MENHFCSPDRIEADWFSLKSLLTETTWNTWNLSDSTYQLKSSVTVPCLSRAIQISKQDGTTLHSGSIRIKLETLESINLVMSFCNLTISNTMLVQLVLTGYKIPLIETAQKNLSKSLLTDNIKNFIFIYPVVQLADSHLYATLMGAYMFARFPTRSQRIIHELLSCMDDPQWEAKATNIFTSDKGCSVKPSIFHGNSKPRLLPPLHLLNKSFQGKAFVIENVKSSLSVEDTHPMSCTLCGSKQTWQFAWKHCGCTTRLPSCFRCALLEWRVQYLQQWRQNQQDSNDWFYFQDEAPLIPLVNCTKCHCPWSLLSLLHVQGDRIWFTSQEEKNPQGEKV